MIVSLVQDEAAQVLLQWAVGAPLAPGFQLPVPLLANSHAYVMSCVTDGQLRRSIVSKVVGPPCMGLDSHKLFVCVLQTVLLSRIASNDRPFPDVCKRSPMIYPW
jgi:hypothetical protein